MDVGWLVKYVQRHLVVTVKLCWMVLLQSSYILHWCTQQQAPILTATALARNTNLPLRWMQRKAHHTIVEFSAGSTLRDGLIDTNTLPFLASPVPIWLMFIVEFSAGSALRDRLIGANTLPFLASPVPRWWILIELLWNLALEVHLGMGSLMRTRFLFLPHLFLYGGY